MEPGAAWIEGGVHLIGTQHWPTSAPLLEPIHHRLPSVFLNCCRSFTSREAWRSASWRWSSSARWVAVQLRYPMDGADHDFAFAQPTSLIIQRVTLHATLPHSSARRRRWAAAGALLRLPLLATTLSWRRGTGGGDGASAPMCGCKTWWGRSMPTGECAGCWSCFPKAQTGGRCLGLVGRGWVCSPTTCSAAGIRCQPTRPAPVRPSHHSHHAGSSCA